MKNVVTTRNDEVIRSPKFITCLFNNPLAGLLWLPIRVMARLAVDSGQPA